MQALLETEGEEGRLTRHFNKPDKTRLHVTIYFRNINRSLNLHYIC